MSGRVLGLLYAGAESSDVRELLRALAAAVFAGRPVALLVLGTPDPTDPEETGNEGEIAEECEALLHALVRGGALVERRASAELRPSDWQDVAAVHRVAPRDRLRRPLVLLAGNGHALAAGDFIHAGQVVFCAAKKEMQEK